jgi:signal transduction protein with GAF and PtsI domain
MSDYTIVNGQLVSVDELKHYGVPGMKWGIRRDSKLAGLRKKARIAAAGEMLIKQQRIQVERLSRKTNRSPKQEERLQRAIQELTSSKKIMKKMATELTPTDIAKGTESLLTRHFILGSPLVSALYQESLYKDFKSRG